MEQPVKLKKTRVRKTPEKRVESIIAQFDLLPFDIKAEVLQMANKNFESQKEKLKAEAQAILDKLK